jgi:hypothetical protein
MNAANAGRLMRPLRETSVGTQFAIITHSKKPVESRPGHVWRDHARA